MRKNQKGFSAVEGLLILVIIGLIGFVAWYVWHVKNAADTTYTSATKVTSVPKQAAIVSDQISFKGQNFSFKTPKGWKTYSGNVSAQFSDNEYVDENGDFFSFDVDPVASHTDFVADDFWTLSSNPKTGSLLVEKETEGLFCNNLPDPRCVGGDGRLVIGGGTAQYLDSLQGGGVTLGAHRYYFMFGNTTKDKGVNLQVFRDILASFKSS